MFRIASLLPRPPVLMAVVIVALCLSAASPAEAMTPAMGLASLAWTDPSLAPLAALAAALGSVGLALRLRQRRSG